MTDEYTRMDAINRMHALCEGIRMTDAGVMAKVVDVTASATARGLTTHLPPGCRVEVCRGCMTIQVRRPGENPWDGHESVCELIAKSFPVEG